MKSYKNAAKLIVRKTVGDESRLDWVSQYREINQ